MFVHLITCQAKKNKFVHLIIQMFVVWFLSSNAPEGLNSGREGGGMGVLAFLFMHMLLKISKSMFKLSQ